MLFISTSISQEKAAYEPLTALTRWYLAEREKHNLFSLERLESGHTLKNIV